MLIYMLLNGINNFIYNFKNLNTITNINRDKYLKNKYTTYKGNPYYNIQFKNGEENPEINSIHEYWKNYRLNLGDDWYIDEVENYNNLFKELLNELVKNDLNNDINLIYNNNNNTILKDETKTKIKNILYINELILTLSYEPHRYYLLKDYEKQQFMSLIKQHLEFYKQYELKNGNLWNNFDVNKSHIIKKRYFENFTYEEYNILKKNAQHFFGNRWKIVLDQFLIGDWNDYTFPINIKEHEVLTSKTNLDKLLHEIFFDYLKPEIPEWLKGTLYEKIINEIINNEYNDNMKQKFIDNMMKIEKSHNYRTY